MAGQVNFYPSTQVPWTLGLAPATVGVSAKGQVSGAVATLAAPGIEPGDVTATIDWGDGTTSAGTVTGTPATTTTIDSLYAVSGAHSYAHAGVYHATVTASAPGEAAVSTAVTIGAAHR
jgi:hexosaminidase